MEYILKNLVLLNGEKDMVPQQGKAILIKDGKIAEIFDENEEKDCKVVYDMGGKTIMPGLINLHCHIPTSGKPSKKKVDYEKLSKLLKLGLVRFVLKKMTQANAKTALYSGVTTIRTVGGLFDFDGYARDQINAGKAVGPRILTSNYAVSVPGGHMAGSLAYEATTPEEAAHFVEVIAKDKPDLIKLMITGGVLDAEVKGEPGILKMRPELVRAACDKAHELGLPVAAHVESPEGVRVALENGVDTIEHGAMPDEKILRLFKDHKAAHVATLSPALPYALFDPSVSHCDEMAQFNGKVVFDGIIDCAKECLANGIPVGLGTDTGCPFITHYDMWREINYFAKYCGVSRKFALHTATAVNASIAGIADEVGTIEAGKRADMIVSSKNPLEDPEALRTLDMIIVRGRRIVKPAVKKMANVEKELDKFL